MMNIKQWKRVHFVGVKGVAMTALALYWAQAKAKVTGSDVPDSFPTDKELKDAGVTVWEEFSEDNIKKANPDMVIYTGAHGGKENPEVVYAKSQNIPTKAHGQALGEIMVGSRQISVAGSHGKTTTSAMIATILSYAGLEPSYAIGAANVRPLGAAGKRGKGDWFVAEADEYVTDPHGDATPRFLWQKPEILVVTNIDFDHPDVYPDLEAVQNAFVALRNKQIGQKLLIINQDDPNSARLLGDGNQLTYGRSPRSDVVITMGQTNADRSFFTLHKKGVFWGEFALKVPGLHNVSNATAAIIAATEVGVDVQTVRDALLTFAGTKRRFEKVGEVGNIIVYDDYAHHPAELKATLAAARRWYPNRRIVAVFQPHTYSRTKALRSEFARAFGDSDITIITEIYASARESDTMDISGQVLVADLTAGGKSAYFVKDKDALMALIGRIAESGDVILCMGAGDIVNWEASLVSHLRT